MKVAVCGVCGKYVILHRSDNVCMYCNSVMKGIADLSGNIGRKYAQECDDMLSGSNFAGALRLCDEYIEKIHESGLLYWCRLLARNNCGNETQILYSGKDIFKDGDFINALEFANEEESKALITLREIHKHIVKRVIFEVEESEKKEKRATNIVYIQESCQDRINEIKNKLKEKTEELDEIERQMKNAVVQRNAYISVRKSIFANYLRKIEEQNNKIQKTTEIEPEEAKKQKIQLSRNLEVCNREYQIIQSQDTDNSYREYKRLSARRNEVEKSIDTLIAELNGLIAKMNSVKQEVESVEEKYKKILDDCRNGNFISAHSLLGKSRIRSVIVPKCLAAVGKKDGGTKKSETASVNLGKKTD